MHKSLYKCKQLVGTYAYLYSYYYDTHVIFLLVYYIWRLYMHFVMFSYVVICTAIRINQDPIVQGLSAILDHFFFLIQFFQYEISFQTTLLPCDLRLNSHRCHACVCCVCFFKYCYRSYVSLDRFKSWRPYRTDSRPM